MNDVILKKVMEPEFFKKLAEMSTEDEVKAMFKGEGIEVTESDLQEISAFIGATLEKASTLSEDELQDIVGGWRDGLVANLDGKLNDWAYAKFIYSNGDFFDRALRNHGGKIVEAGLGTLIVGLGVGGTLGIQKLYKVGKEKGWWGKSKSKKLV